MSSHTSKPCISPPQAMEILQRIFGLTVSKMSSLPSCDDQNYHIISAEGHAFVLKIFNSEDSRNAEMLDVQISLMIFLKEKGLPIPTPLLTKDGKRMCLVDTDCGSGPQSYMVILLTFLPGIPGAKIKFTPQLCYEVGRAAASLDRLLQEFQHPGLKSLDRKDFIWSLANTPVLEKHLSILGQQTRQQLVQNVITQFKEQVQPNLN
uniref:Hydroxylysine kinase n=2 Tax=Erpetoichthys calabaricus TaxID=27687 RepID=A0A8C4T3W6_ERPCA